MFWLDIFVFHFPKIFQKFFKNFWKIFGSSQNACLHLLFCLPISQGCQIGLLFTTICYQNSISAACYSLDHFKIRYLLLSGSTFKFIWALYYEIGLFSSSPSPLWLATLRSAVRCFGYTRMGRIWMITSITHEKYVAVIFIDKINLFEAFTKDCSYYWA